MRWASLSATVAAHGKKVLLPALLLLLLLPALQARLRLVRVRKLGGYVADQVPPPRPSFSWAGLRDNSYQTQLEAYLAANLGFRAELIRLRNQLAYSFFYTAHANHVLVGRDQVLFEERPIYAYLGADFVGDAVVQHHVRRFRAMQDTLARRGKLLVFVAVPSKASFMPENLPDYFRQQRPQRSNYQAYAAALRAAGVNFLDLSHAFHQWKDTASFPLFPRGGIHWSVYGASLAGDTLLHYLAHHYPHGLRAVRAGRAAVSTDPQSNDDDILRAMNLLWQPAAYPMAYPTFRVQPLAPGQRRPNLLLIGDSFSWLIMHPFISQVFDAKQSRFWFYNREVAWPAKAPEGPDVWALDRKQQYLSRDIIVVMFTEYNMLNLDGGFSDNAYNLFTPYSPADSAAIRKLELRLNERPASKDYWWKKSNETGIPEQQLLHQRAVEAYDSLRS